MLLCASPVMAASIVVDSNPPVTLGSCTLQDAIISANTDTATGGCAAGSGDDTITFAAGLTGQTITLTSALPQLNSNIIIDGSSLSSNHVKISGANAYQVFNITAGKTVTLNHLDIINGKSSGEGGGIYNNGGMLTVSNSIFSGNSAEYCGGISNYNSGTLTISNSIFSGNSSSGGGGICSNYILTVSNSAFLDNSASGSGGIFDGGGGILNDGLGTMTVTNCTFSGNSARIGGGILNFYMLTVSNSTFSGNSASYGGGILNSVMNGGILTVSNSTFSDNSASSDGGGVYNEAMLTVSNSTFSGNSAGSGGGIFNDGGLILKNSILTNSTSGGDCVNIYMIDTNLNNLIMDGSCSDGGVSFKSGNPLLGGLADNGGSTQTMSLSAGSPAINAGDSATCTTTDQRGYARVGICDIGAYESEYTSVTAGVTLTGISSITGSTVFATGNATGTGITERGFYWWIPPTAANHFGGSESGLIPEGGYGAGDFSLRLTDLRLGNTYHVKAYIKVGGQIITSDEQIFTTATTGSMAPTVHTDTKNFTVSGSSITVSGEITDIGASQVNVYGFVYAPHTAPFTGDNMRNRRQSLCDVGSDAAVSGLEVHRNN